MKRVNHIFQPPHKPWDATAFSINARRHNWWATWIMALALIFPNLVLAKVQEQVCDRAAQSAATKTGVPLSVLLAITRTETGRTKGGATTPWPWTVNMEGKGVWFDTEDQARSYVFRHFKKGARSFDVGCFQINYKWHGSAFDSIDAMFDPNENATYAARFLKSLHSELGDWSKAAGAYHSRTPKYANRYKARFDRIHNGLTTSKTMAPSTIVAAAVAPKPPAQNNAFPLLQSGSIAANLGSLVPLNDANSGKSIFKPNPIAGE